MSSIIDSYTVVDESSVQGLNVNDNPYLREVFNYAVRNAVSSLDSYWSSEDAQKIINEYTFPYIWNNFKDIRTSLLSVLIKKATDGGYHSRVKSISEDFAKEFLENLYNEIPVDFDLSNNRLRISVIPSLFEGYDYMRELNRTSLLEDNKEIFGAWKRVAMERSNDSNVYDFLWSKIKRAKGATDLKKQLLDAAINKDALSASLIKKIAKSSPKSLKRVVVSGISRKVYEQRRLIRRMSENTLEYTADEVLALQKNVATQEELAMLFVGCDDYSVVESLMDCLSRDNLPWLMPAASGHYWLSQRLSRTLEENQS
tara:strand:- start:7473 stop:8414 length:942 start_codon:yes stop_codon:yes gene_type:complete